MVRVAAAQFAVGTDREANLATARRMTDRAATEGAALVVLPEFCNHPSWYDDGDHARAVAVRLGDDWLDGLADRARAHGIWLACNVTRVADDGVTLHGSNLLYAPDGTLAGVSDKQVLMGGESLHLSPSITPSPVIDTPFGRVGSYSCMDGVIFETPRLLAVQGAQVLCNSLNSFAADEATLHVPVRAVENRVFVVAANKVGPLVPEHAAREVAGKLGIPVEALEGAGESQIVAPTGKVLAIAPPRGEAVVVADIDPALAADKRRPDGTDVLAARRPSLYGPLGGAAAPRGAPAGADAIVAGVVQDDGEVPALARMVAAAAADGADLLVLPELAGVFGGAVVDVADAARTGHDLVTALTDVLGGTAATVVTSVVVDEEGETRHEGVVVTAEGVVARQPQLHASGRRAWVTTLGDRVEPVTTPWGRLAVVVGDDHLFPEVARLAALDEVDVLAVPFDAVEAWETDLGLVERSAENRLCVVAATRPNAPGTSIIATLERDFTLWTVWEERAFDGTISRPRVTRAADTPGVTTATIHPANAANRILTRATDVVASRPWRLLEPLLEATP